MLIRWLGHSCFFIETADGIRIVTDPFNEKVGYPVPAVEADITVCSHGHYDHHSDYVLKGKPVVVDKPGHYEEKGINFFGIETDHDTSHGTERGKNIIFLIEAEGIKLAHCGDIGAIPEKEKLERVGNPDVLFIPVGGFYTIDAVTAMELVQVLKPKMVLPMHYKTPVMNFPIAGVDSFTKIAGKYIADVEELQINKNTLPAECTTYVFRCPCR